MFDVDTVEGQERFKQQSENELEETKKKNVASKYISDISKASEKKKVEQSLVYEKMAEKQLSRENKQFGNKDRYITSSYLKMMEEGKQFLKEDEEKEKFNKAHSVGNEENALGLYKTLYQNDIFAGGHRPDIAQIMDKKNEQIRTNEMNKSSEAAKSKDTIPSSEEQPVKESNSKVLEQPSRKEIPKSRSKSRSKSPRGRNEPKIEKKEPKENKEPKEEVEPPKPEKVETKEDKIKSAKERYLQRKLNQLQE